MNKKGMLIMFGTIGGIAVLGAGAVALWNSKQMRMMRAAKRTGKILYKVGSVLQTVSGITEEC